MNKRVVVTGIGVVNPSGGDKEEVWKNCLSGVSKVRKITKNPSGVLPVTRGGAVEGCDGTKYISPRLIRKIDPFTRYALVASAQALEDAGVDPAAEEPARLGVVVGNCFGGWSFTDPELRRLHTLGAASVSPYQATAWFPAAPQGQISIAFGLKGYGKTVVCDRASGLAAVGYAARAVAAGKSDLILAGGTEALLNPFIMTSCKTSGILSLNGDFPAENSYRPFDAKRNGMVLGEGAGMLVLEERERAMARNATIYAEIKSFALTGNGRNEQSVTNGGRRLAKCMETAISGAYLDNDDINYIMLEGASTKVDDVIETEAIKSVFNGRCATLPASAPKSMFGHMYGAAGAVDAALASLSIKRGTILPTINQEYPDMDCDLDYVPNKAREYKVKNSVVIARGMGGVNSCLVLGRYE